LKNFLIPFLSYVHPIAFNDYGGQRHYHYH